MLTVEGLHVPLTPLVDVVGSVGTVPLLQMIRLVPKGNVGTVRGMTVTFKLTGKPHCPGVGLKV